MSRKSIGNSVIDVSAWLATKQFNPDFFSIENKTIKFDYFRTEGTIKGFNERDLIRLKEEMFGKGWLHTNIFYQANGKITSKTEKITNNFIDNIYDHSKVISFNSPRDQLRIVNNSPIDNAFIYLFNASTENNAKAIISDISGGEYKSIANPVVSENGFSVCFSDKNGGYPILFIATEAKTKLFSKIRKAMGLVHEMNHERGTYKLDFEDRKKFYDIAFEQFKAEIEESDLFNDISKRKESEDELFDYNQVSRNVTRIIINNIIEVTKKSISDMYYEFLDFANLEKTGELSIGRDSYFRTILNSGSYRSIYGLLVFNGNADFKTLNFQKNIDSADIFVKFSYLSSRNEYDQFHVGKKIVDHLFEYANHFKSKSNRSKVVDIIKSMVNSGMMHFSEILRMSHVRSSISRIIELINLTISTLVIEKSESITKIDFNDNNQVYEFSEIVAKGMVNYYYQEMDSYGTMSKSYNELINFVYIYLTETKFYIKNNKYIGMNYLFIYDIFAGFTSRNRAATTWDINNERFVKDGNYSSSHISQFAIDSQDGRLKFIYSDFSDDSFSGMNMFEIKSINENPKNIMLVDCHEYVSGIKQVPKILHLHTPNNCDSDGNNTVINNYREYIKVLFEGDLTNFNLVFKFMEEFKVVNDKLNPQDKDSLNFTDSYIYPTIDYSRLILANKSNRITNYYILEDDVNYDELSRNFSIAMMSKNRQKNNMNSDSRGNINMNFSIVSNPAVVEVNSKKYSLGRIGYDISLYIRQGGRNRYDEYYSPNSALNISNGEVVVLAGDRSKKAHSILISTTPHSPFKDNSATSSMDQHNKNAGKAGHPHFASRTFLCHAGAGSKTYFEWITNKYGPKNHNYIAINDMGELAVMIKKSDFYEFMDLVIDEVHALTKSCYNRKTRSHPGLNIEEWGHCRIE